MRPVGGFPRRSCAPASCVFKAVLWPVCLSPVFLLLLTRSLSRSRSAFSCCVASGCNYPRPIVPAGVAVHSIPVATTVQRVPWRGIESQGVRSGVWCNEGLPRSRRSSVFERQNPGHGSGSTEPVGRCWDKENATGKKRRKRNKNEQTAVGTKKSIRDIKKQIWDKTKK